MFIKSAEFYDAIYANKDYWREAARVAELIEDYKAIPDDSLLDVACGTGEHIRYLQDQYQIEGLDLDANLLAIARQKNPEITFHEGNMIDFDLGRQYAIITCLFSAIGYVRTVPNLERAIAAMRRHLLPGGVMIVEPWLTPEMVKPGHVSANFVDRPDLKIARMTVLEVESRLAIVDFNYLVGRPEGIEYFTERHEAALFTIEEYKAAFEKAGMAVDHDPEGLIGRGLYIGTLPRG